MPPVQQFDSLGDPVSVAALQSIHQTWYLSWYLSIHRTWYLSRYLSSYLSIHQIWYLSRYLSWYLSWYLSIHQTWYLSWHLSIQQTWSLSKLAPWYHMHELTNCQTFWIHLKEPVTQSLGSFNYLGRMTSSFSPLRAPSLWEVAGKEEEEGILVQYSSGRIMEEMWMSIIIWEQVEQMATLLTKAPIFFSFQIFKLQNLDLESKQINNKIILKTVKS